MTSVKDTQANESQGWRSLANRHTGERVQLRRVLRDGRLCLEVRGMLPPHREGPPLHVHYQEDEAFTIVAGTLSAEVDGRPLHVDVGRTAPLPMGSAHRWWNASDETLVLEGVVTPVVDFDVFLSAAFDVLNSGPASRPPVFYMAHLAWRHRKTQATLFAPRWTQAVVLPLIVFLGTILGRYRGTEWPGCPARCTPAPLVDTHHGLQEPRPSTSVA